MKTREQWLLQATRALTPDFKRAGVELPDVRVSIGWPGGRGNKQHVIGQCWMPFAVLDGKPAIFISPALDGAKPERILDVLVHELVHATGLRGHRGEFSKLAAKMGLVAPWTATTASELLAERLGKLALRLGPFPHAAVDAGHGLSGAGPTQPPVQSTRMLKVSCDQCGYTLRATQKWLDTGIPQCPNEECDAFQMTVEPPKETR